MIKFLKKKKKGSFNGQPVGGGVCIIGVIILIYCLWPYVKNINTDKVKNNAKASMSSAVEVGKEQGSDIIDGVLDAVLPDSEDSSNEVTNNANANDNNGSNNSDDESVISESEDTNIIQDDDYTVDISVCKDLAAKVKIGEEDPDKSHDTPRSDWEGKSFKCPISGKKSGMKNYAIETLTGQAYNSDEFSYTCPYSHEVVTKAKNIDWEHIIPLNYVDKHGGWAWSKEAKQEYAYNLDNGVCTWNKPNRVKGSKGPSEYMPDYNKKWYCYKWLEIATRYDIPISQADYDVIVKTLGI